MLHADRIWCVFEVAAAEELARNLTETTWCCCQAFQIAGHPYIWLNDSTSEDGAQEYAVCRWQPSEKKLYQLETITFSWCGYRKALQLIQATLAGEDDSHGWARQVNATIQTVEEHTSCEHCI